MSKAKKAEPEVDARKWCASWLFKAKTKALPPGVSKAQVVRDTEPTKVDLQGRLVGPPGGGRWVREVPPAWVT